MEKRKVDVKLLASQENLKTIAADMVSFESVNGYVTMNFLQTTKETETEKGIVRHGIVGSRVMVSWEHFVKLFVDMGVYIKKTQEEAEDQHNYAVKVANNIEFGSNDEL